MRDPKYMRELGKKGGKASAASRDVKAWGIRMGKLRTQKALARRAAAPPKVPKPRFYPKKGVERMRELGRLSWLKRKTKPDMRELGRRGGIKSGQTKRQITRLSKATLKKRIREISRIDLDGMPRAERYYLSAKLATLKGALAEKRAVEFSKQNRVNFEGEIS